MAEWVEKTERDQAVTGAHYRTTYYFAGPHPPEWVRAAVINSVAAVAPRAGIRTTGQAFYTSADRNRFPAWPQVASWAYVVAWRKERPGTVLAFFMGPAGLLTLAILAAVVAIAGIVIVKRQVEELLERVPGLTPLFSPATVVAILVALAVIFGAKGVKR